MGAWVACCYGMEGAKAQVRGWVHGLRRLCLLLRSYSQPGHNGLVYLGCCPSAVVDALGGPLALSWGCWNSQNKKGSCQLPPAATSCRQVPGSWQRVGWCLIMAHLWAGATHRASGDYALVAGRRQACGLEVAIVRGECSSCPVKRLSRQLSVCRPWARTNPGS